MHVEDSSGLHVREPFEKFMDWRQWEVVMQSEAVTVMPSCSVEVT